MTPRGRALAVGAAVVAAGGVAYLLTTKPTAVPPPAPVSFSFAGQETVTANKVYIGRYVINSTAFGFIWLNTETRTAGEVGLVGTCAGAGVPGAVSNLYIFGDCNGHGALGLSADHNRVVALNIGGGCSVLCKGNSFCATCGQAGSTHRVLGIHAFAVILGAWNYDATYNESTTPDMNPGQTADPQGNRWSITCTPPGPGVTLTTCVWTPSGTGPTPPPVTAVPTAIGPTPHPSSTAIVVPPTATPCLAPPWGVPGPFGLCYDCSGNSVGTQPCAPKTATPAPSLTRAKSPTTTATRTHTPGVAPRPPVRTVPFR